MRCRRARAQIPHPRDFPRKFACDTIRDSLTSVPRSLPVLAPVSIRLDPFGAGGWRRWQWQLEDVDRLTRSPALADRHDARIAALLDRLDSHRLAEHRRLERDGDVILEHACPSGNLLGFTVGIDRRLLGHGFEACEVVRYSVALLVRCSLRHDDLQSFKHVDVSRPGPEPLGAASFARCRAVGSDARRRTSRAAWQRPAGRRREYAR